MVYSYHDESMDLYDAGDSGIPVACCGDVQSLGICHEVILMDKNFQLVPMTPGLAEKYGAAASVMDEALDALKLSWFAMREIPNKNGIMKEAMEATTDAITRIEGKRWNP